MGWNSYFDAPLLTALLNGQGIPPIDQPAQLYKNTAFGPIPISTIVSVPAINVAKYNMVTIGITETNGALGSVNGVREVDLIWYADAALTQQVWLDRASYYPSGGGPQWEIATKGAWLQIQFVALNAGAANATAWIQVTGSMRTVTQTKVAIYNAQTGSGHTIDSGYAGVWTAGGLIHTWAPGDNLEWPISWAGPGTLTVDAFNGVTTGLVVSLQYQSSNATIGLITLPASTAESGQTINVQIPAGPVTVDVLNLAGVAQSAYVSLVMDGIL